MRNFYTILAMAVFILLALITLPLAFIEIAIRTLIATFIMPVRFALTGKRMNPYKQIGRYDLVVLNVFAVCECLMAEARKY